MRHFGLQSGHDDEKHAEPVADVVRKVLCFRLFRSGGENTDEGATEVGLAHVARVAVHGDDATVGHQLAHRVVVDAPRLDVDGSLEASHDAVVGQMTKPLAGVFVPLLLRPL